MNDVDLILDTAQAMESIGRPIRAKELRAAALRMIPPKGTRLPKLKVIDGLPDDIIMLVSHNGDAVKFVVGDG